MLPFLKLKDDGVGVGPVETKARKSDTPKEYGMLDAIWDDLSQAVHEKDKDRGIAALEALCEYIREADQDQTHTGDSDDD